MNIITKLPGPLLIFLGALSLSFGGLIVKSFEGATLWQILFWRSLFFTLTVLAFLIISYKGKTLKSFHDSGLPGFFGGIILSFGFCGYVFAMYNTTVANTNFIISLQILFLAIFGYFFLKEKINKITLISIILAITGVLLMVGNSLSPGELSGNLAAFTMPISFAVLIMIVRKYPTVDMIPAQFIAGVFSCLIGFVLSTKIMISPHDIFLGFLAGLWLAPFIEKNLLGVFSIFVILPVCVLGASFAWTMLPDKIRHSLPDGWEAALLIPVVLIFSYVSFELSTPLENVFFDGDLRFWISNELGISYDQRNAMVVGIAMGFAVIPTIFSIAEDAIFTVPRHLTYGSLALGATPWQSLYRVVLPTASPGIFSALMIGMGRAVGETMIVLMATGNTPIIDASIFEGMRTLAANIAVEIPESEVDSTHYRILFLAALVLFLFTFAVNTIAEVVRQQLRGKYSTI